MARKGILGTKLGMTQVFDENNRVVPVTVALRRTGRQVAGIWPIPGSRAYCSGCLAPGLGLVGHTTSAQTGASGPILGTRRISALK